MTGVFVLMRPETEVRLLEPLLEMAFELIEAAGDAVVWLTVGRRRERARARYGAQYRARWPLELKGCDLRRDGAAASFRARLPAGTVVRVAQEAQPVDTDVGVTLEGDMSCIPPEYRVAARAYGYLLYIPARTLTRSFELSAAADAMPAQPRVRRSNS